jgi:hypothetical protein
LEQHHEEIQSAGLNLVVVGIGQPKHAQRYGPRLAPSALCLVDSGTDAHRTYGLKRGGILQLAGPKVFASGVRATARGAGQGEVTGDTTMLSGTFVIDQDGLVRWAHYSSHAGDHPDIGQMLEDVRLEATRA